MRSYYESENSLGLDGNADIVICRNGWTTFKVDCKINPNAVRTKKDQLPLKWCLPQTHFLGADLLSSITYSERIKIETFCELGLANVQMAERLKRSPSTISYELSRCQPYQAELAQVNAKSKRSRCGRKTKLDAKLKQTILNHLRLSWSPEVIAHELKLATKSIYNWLYQGKFEFSLSELPEHGLRQRRNLDQRSKYNQSLGRSIEQRPIVINQRNRIGDFEIDTVVGPRGHSKAVLLTLVDRKSRFLWAYRLKDRTAATVNEALTQFLATFKGPVHSFTVDRGTEFSNLVSFEPQYGIQTYYCHAYAPAERGSNERFNRNLRYFYPKGTCFEHISAQNLTTTLLQINQRPLKVLNWQTPYQVMLTNLSENSD